MASEHVTVCLENPSPEDVLERIAAALEPYNLDHNADGRWDHWTIFRGHGEHRLAVRPGHGDDPRLIFNPTADAGDRWARSLLRCAGGPVGLLDFETGRAEAAVRAGAAWDRWSAFADRFPPAVPVQHFFDRSSADPDGYPFQQARRDHMDQPVIRALLAAENIDPAQMMFQQINDPVSEYGHDRDVYVRRHINSVIPTSALLTLDGRWVDSDDFIVPGDLRDEVVYFSYERLGRYYGYADHYLDSLDGDVTIVRLRVHC